MQYFTGFYYECLTTGLESHVEVYFTRDESPADLVEYWGQMIALPATEEVEITSVFRDGKIWEDYPDTIETEIYSHDWEAQILCAQA